jgi:hypothetical protein
MASKKKKKKKEKEKKVRFMQKMRCKDKPLDTKHKEKKTITCKQIFWCV